MPDYRVIIHDEDTEINGWPGAVAIPYMVFARNYQLAVGKQRKVKFQLLL
jgi:hypothetical protein